MVFKGNSDNAKTVLCTRQGSSAPPVRRRLSAAVVLTPAVLHEQVSVGRGLPLRRSLQLCARRRRNTLADGRRRATPYAHLRAHSCREALRFHLVLAAQVSKKTRRTAEAHRRASLPGVAPGAHPGTRTAQRRRVARASVALHALSHRRLALRPSCARLTRGFLTWRRLSLFALRALSSLTPRTGWLLTLTRGRARPVQYPGSVHWAAQGSSGGWPGAGGGGSAAQGGAMGGALLCSRGSAEAVASPELRARVAANAGAVAALLGNSHQEAPALARACSVRQLCRVLRANLGAPRRRCAT